MQGLVLLANLRPWGCAQQPIEASGDSVPFIFFPASLLVWFRAAALIRALCACPFAETPPVELSVIQYRSTPEEVKEYVLFILRRGCRAGLELL